MRVKTCSALLLLPFLAIVIGCGGSGGSGMTAATNLYSFSGEWGTRPAFGANPLASPIEAFVGTLSASNGVVTGGLTPIPASVSTSCLPLSLTPIAVSGTVDSSGNLTITLPVGGGAATLTAVLPSNVETEAAGSFKIVGGTCAMAATAMQIAQFAPLNGTYTGSFSLLNSSGQPVAGTTTTITAILAQSAIANSNGQFPVTGSVAVTGACSAAFTLSNSIAWGGILEASDSSLSYIFAGESDPTAATVEGFFTNENSSAGCPFGYNQEFIGTLTRQ